MSANELHIPFVGPGEVLAAGIILPMVGCCVVALRLWLRSIQKTKVGPDDYTIAMSLLFVMGMGICVVYGVAKHSLAYSTPPLSSPTLEAQLTNHPGTNTGGVVALANGLIKLSALFLYRRFFVVNKWSKFDIISKISLVLCTLWTVAFFFATLFGCGTNIDYSWKPLIFVASCNTNVRLESLMITDLVTDIIVWLLPIPVIWSLAMKTSKKAYVTGILMLAAVSLAAAVVRLIIETEILNGGYAAHTDVNLTLTNLLYWTMIESGLALISACLPTLHYFAARSTIRVGSIRSLLHLDSLRSPFSSRVTGTSGTSPYSEITVVKAFRVSSVRDNDEISEYSSKREARGDSEIAMVTLKPGEAHSKV